MSDTPKPPSEEMLLVAREIMNRILRLQNAIRGGYDVGDDMPSEIIAQALASQQADHDKLYMAACDKVRELGGQIAELQGIIDRTGVRSSLEYQAKQERQIITLTEKLSLARNALELIRFGKLREDHDNYQLMAGRLVSVARECLLQIGGKDG